MWLSIVGGGQNDYDFVLTVNLNDVKFGKEVEFFILTLYHSKPVQVSSPNINLGINTIHVSVDDNYFMIYRMVIFIEYEYLT